jgi:hypothetical protein
MRALERTQDPRFLFEAPAELGAAVCQELDRNLASSLAIEGAIHGPHAALAELRFKTIATRDNSRCT